jgi:flagellin-like hook-associated protein FlgL
MGFNTPAYHSTKQDPAVLLPRPPASSRRGTDFGVHVGNADQANSAIIPTWHENLLRSQISRPDMSDVSKASYMKDLENSYSNSQVMPLMVNKGTSFEVPDFGRWNSSNNMLHHVAKERGAYPNYELKAGIKTNDEDALKDLINRSATASDEEHTKNIEDIMRERNYGSIAYPNETEGRRGVESLMFTDPDRIRSRFAAFDPFRRNAAIAAAMGVAAPDLLAALEEWRPIMGMVTNETGDVDVGAALRRVDAAIAKVTEALSTLGTQSKSVGRQVTFLNKLQDATEAGIGNLVDADLAKESARLTALQTKQQLGVQALSIANSSSQTLLSLFRN